MKINLAPTVFCALILAISALAQENRTMDDKLRAHLHKEYFTLNILIQSEGRYSFEDNKFQGGSFYYCTGIFNGSGLEKNNNNMFYGIGRLQYSVKDILPGYIQFAVSGSHGNSEGFISGSRGPLLRGV